MINEERISGFLTGYKQKASGFNAGSFGDVLYEQIVPFPQTLDYGQITSDKQLDTQLWNAFRSETRTLENYNIDGEGVIEIDLTLPKTFQPMEIIEFKATAIAAQSLKLSGKIIYDFTEETLDPYQFILGNSLFVFKSHWDFNRSNSERFQFFTSIHKAYDGTEHRVQMVDNARLNVTVNYTLFDDERRELEGYVYERLGDEMGMPLFSEMTFTDTITPVGANEILCNTKYSIFQSGQLAYIVSGKKNAIVEINDVQFDRIILQNPMSEEFPADSFISPVIKGYIPDGISMERATNDISQMAFTFRAKDNDSLHLDNFTNVTLPVYQSLPVFNTLPERNGHRNVFENEYEVVEYAWGPMYINKKWTKSENVFNYSFINFSKEDQYNIKALINYAKGRLNEFWLPTWIRDMEIKEVITSTETQLKMYYNNLVNSYQNGGYHIRIKLTDGTEYYREILAFQNSQNENEEIITIDSPLNRVVNVEDVEIIDFIEKVRFDTDVFTLNIASNEISQINLNMRSSV